MQEASWSDDKASAELPPFPRTQALINPLIYHMAFIMPMFIMRKGPTNNQPSFKCPTNIRINNNRSIVNRIILKGPADNMTILQYNNMTILLNKEQRRHTVLHTITLTITLLSYCTVCLLPVYLERLTTSYRQWTMSILGSSSGCVMCDVWYVCDWMTRWKWPQDRWNERGYIDTGMRWMVGWRGDRCR